MPDTTADEYCSNDSLVPMMSIVLSRCFTSYTSQQLICKWAVLDLIEPFGAFFGILTVSEVRLFQHEQHHFQAQMFGAVLLDIIIKRKEALQSSINLQGVSLVAAPHFTSWTKLFCELSVAQHPVPLTFEWNLTGVKVKCSKPVTLMVQLFNSSPRPTPPNHHRKNHPHNQGRTWDVSPMPSCLVRAFQGKYRSDPVYETCTSSYLLRHLPWNHWECFVELQPLQDRQLHTPVVGKCLE